MFDAKRLRKASFRWPRTKTHRSLAVGASCLSNYKASALQVANALFLGILGLPGDTAGRSYTSPEDPVAFSYWLACQLMVGQVRARLRPRAHGNRCE